jgi:hypothetical protein
MSYTYLPTSPHTSHPAIVMTTNAASRKITNIVSNPAVSILVHDCKPRLPHHHFYGTYKLYHSRTYSLTHLSCLPGVSHRPPTHTRRLSGGSPAPEPPSSLASLLLNLNTTEMSSISATIGGAARLAPQGSDEERYFCEQHLENNTYDEGDAPTLERSATEDANGNRSHLLAGEEIRVIVVDIKDVRISDWKGNVRDLALVPANGSLVNGTS